MDPNSPQAARPEEKLTKPDEKPPVEDPVVTEAYLIEWHRRINHCTYHKKDDCQRCCCVS